jgi:lysophospholipase L1-like esterase
MIVFRTKLQIGLHKIRKAKGRRSSARYAAASEAYKSQELELPCRAKSKGQRKTIIISGTAGPCRLWSDNHCALAENTDGSTARYDRINQLNAWIKQYAFDNNLICVDYHSALVAADGEHYKPELTFDGVHPSAAGYALMSPMVEDAITADELK